MPRKDFRKLALALSDAEEKSHFGKADFRVKNKIFAGFNDKGMAKCCAEEDVEASNLTECAQIGTTTPITAIPYSKP